MKTICKHKVIHLDLDLEEIRDEEYIQIHLVRGKSQDEKSMLLLDWVELKQEEYRKKAEVRGRRPGTANGVGTLKSHLQVFLAEKYPKPVYLDQVDKDFCAAFAGYLQSARNLRVGNVSKPLAESTRKRLFAQFGALLGKAVRSGFLSENPIERMDRSDKPKATPPARTYRNKTGWSSPSGWRKRRNGSSPP